MASAHLYDAVIGFLGGDAGDLLTFVNTDAGSTLLVAGSVNAARDRRGFPRDGKVPDVSVEIVRGPSVADRFPGIGCVERDVVLDLYCTVRRKDTPKGQTQIGVLEQLSRALIQRYQGVSNLAVTVSGATFLRSSAAILTNDVDSTVAEPARASVRAVFTFLDELAAST